MNIINIRLGCYHLHIDKDPFTLAVRKNTYWNHHKYPKFFEIYNWFNHKHKK